METSIATVIIQFRIDFSLPSLGDNPIHPKEKQAYAQAVNKHIQD